jgi:hypothetical protein
MGEYLVVARLQGNDVAGLGALGALFDLELDTLAFYKRAVALGLDGRLMYKDIRASVTRYKAIAPACIEPFDGAGNSLTHCFVSLSSKYVGWSALRTGEKTKPPKQKMPGR